MSRRRCGTQLDATDLASTEFAPGRASVHNGELAPDDANDGRSEVMDGRSLTSWIVWDWSRSTDERLETLCADVYDLADRVHYLNITIMVAFLVIVLALSALVAAVAL